MKEPLGRPTHLRPRRVPRYALAAALLAGGAAGCSGSSGPTSSALISVCGTTLWQSAEAVTPHQVPSAGPGAGTPAAPAASQLPPTLGSGADAGSIDYVPAIILVTSDCSSDPVVTVTPVDAARTITVAHTQPGGVAGLYLGLSKTAVTVREYENGKLTGSLSLP